MTEQIADDVEAQWAHAILTRFYAPAEFGERELAAAIDQVRRDPEGARILANNEQIPPGRDDLRLARSTGLYLPTEGA